MSDSESDYMSDESFSDGPAPAKKKGGSKTQAGGKSKSSSPSSSTSTPPLSGSTSNGKKGNASDQYQKLSQLEHILKRPDTYIGSVEKSTTEMWCFDQDNGRMEYKDVTIVPGLFKIFDEILVNAADNKIRDPLMKNIRVSIDPENNLIEVLNDGKGIPVEIHNKEKFTSLS